MTFQITIEPSGRRFEAEPDETLLNAAIRHGIPLPYGCKDGACGSCKCQRRAGEIAASQGSGNALSAQEQAEGWVLTCCSQARSDVTLEARQVGSADAFPVKKFPVRVQGLERLTPDVMRLTLQLPANDTFRYHAGQYLEFVLRDGSRRAYSMALDPGSVGEKPHMELHIRHLPGGRFTDHVFGDMKIKEILRAEGPLGGFFLREDSPKPIVFLASGTGFAPVKAMLQQLQRQQSTRDVTVYWGGRRPTDLYDWAWLETLQTAWPGLRCVPVVSDALPEDAWRGRSGWVHQAVLQDLPNLSGHEVYACGAPAMVGAAQRDFVALAGLPTEAFFADAFTSALDKLA